MTESRYSSRAASWYVAILCLFGAVRIFWGAAGLPLFNDVDEDAHFDVVHKFARGQWPDRCQQTPDDETVRLLVMYSSREFLVPPESFPEGVYPPPPWTLSLTASRDAYVEDLTAVFGRWVNHETHSPPLYYGLAAVWYDLGRLVGLHGPYAAYWVRFLNIPLYVALIVAAYGFCRAYFSPTVALAVPALVAVFPSTVFFGINNDVLSPLMLLLALWLLLRWHAESASAWLSIAAGFAVSATVLVKLSNIAVLAACGVVALSGLYGAWKAGQFRQKCFPASLLLVSAAGPLAAWMLRNRLVLGDWTGDAEKIRLSGWQVKPWGQLFDHPLFSVAGQRTFWSTLVRTFYEGDMNWHGRWAMGFFPSEIVFYLSLAVLLIGLGTIWIGHRGRAKTRLASCRSAECAGDRWNRLVPDRTVLEVRFWNMVPPVPAGPVFQFRATPLRSAGPRTYSVRLRCGGNNRPISISNGDRRGNISCDDAGAAGCLFHAGAAEPVQLVSPRDARARSTRSERPRRRSCPQLRCLRVVYSPRPCPQLPGRVGQGHCRLHGGNADRPETRRGV